MQVRRYVTNCPYFQSINLDYTFIFTQPRFLSSFVNSHFELHFSSQTSTIWILFFKSPILSLQESLCVPLLAIMFAALNKELDEKLAKLDLNSDESSLDPVAPVSLRRSNSQTTRRRREEKGHIKPLAATSSILPPPPPPHPHMKVKPDSPIERVSFGSKEHSPEPLPTTAKSQEHIHSPSQRQVESVKCTASEDSLTTAQSTSEIPAKPAQVKEDWEVFLESLPPPPPPPPATTFPDLESLSIDPTPKACTPSTSPPNSRSPTTPEACSSETPPPGVCSLITPSPGLRSPVSPPPELVASLSSYRTRSSASPLPELVASLSSSYRTRSPTTPPYRSGSPITPPPGTRSPTTPPPSWRDRTPSPYSLPSLPTSPISPLPTTPPKERPHVPRLPCGLLDRPPRLRGIKRKADPNSNLDACRYEHPKSGGGGGFSNQNRFGALSQQSGSGGSGAGFGKANLNSIGSLTDDLVGGNRNNNNNKQEEFALTTTDIVSDVTAGKNRPEWIFSAYGPGRDAPIQLLGGPEREQSFEEMRLRHYMAAAAGNPQQAVNEALQVYQQIEQQLETIRKDPDGAIRFVVAAKNEHPNRIDICRQGMGQAAQPAASGFGNQQPAQPASGFGQPGVPGAPSAFGQHTMPGASAVAPSAFGQPAFGQTSAPTPFGQPSTLGAQSSAFGQPSTLGTGGTAFGQTSAPGAGGTAFGQSAFGQPAGLGATPSPFGQPQPQQQQQQQPAQASGFGQPTQPSGFGAPTQATQFRPNFCTFGKPATASPAAATGFGSAPAQPATGFGQPSQPQAQAAPASNIFGQPSQAPQQATTGFGAPAPQAAQPFGAPAAPTTTAPATQAPSGQAAGQARYELNPLTGFPTIWDENAPTTRNPSTNRLQNWKGRQVVYKPPPKQKPSDPSGEEVPFYQHPNGHWQRIWYPNGREEEVRVEDLEGKDEEYTEEVVKKWEEFFRTKKWPEGGLPTVPPRQAWLKFDF